MDWSPRLQYSLPPTWKAQRYGDSKLPISAHMFARLSDIQASVCSDTLYALLPLIFVRDCCLSMLLVSTTLSQAISQTLIITRLGLTRFIATVLDQPFSAPSHAMAPTSPTDGETGIIIERRGGREKGHWTTMSVDIDAIHSQLRAL
jgi:hypothetical protein